MDDAPSLPEDLARRYMVRRILGEGSFGQVLEAGDVELERVVAIKLLHASLHDEEQEARFAREGRLTAQLRHPNIVACYDHGVAADGTPFLVYELIHGETLLERMRRVGLRPPEEIRAVGTGIAGALTAAHAADILHRDVKPENIMRRQDGSYVLCDFGVAHSEQPDAVQTAEGVLLGTLEYMAPELMLGASASPATDAFALGATLYMLRFGEPPYPGLSPGELAEVARGRDGPSPPAPPSEDAELDQVLLRAVAPRPSQRFPDLETLQAALGGEEVGGAGDTLVLTASSPDLLGTDTAAVGRPTRRARRRGLVPWLVGGAGLLALGGTGAWWFRARPAPTRPAPAAAREPDPAAAASAGVPAEVRDAWLRFVGYRLGADQSLRMSAGTHEYRIGHLSELSQAILDPRFELRAKRFLDLLRAWLAEESPRGAASSETRDFLVEVSTVFAWIARDVEVAALRGSLGMKSLETEGTGIGEAFREIDQAISYHSPFAALARQLGETSAAIHARGAAPASILLRAVWGGKFQGEDPPQVEREAWEALRATDDPVLRAELLPWIAKLILAGKPTEIDCAALIERLEELMHLPTRPGLAPGRELWLLRELGRAVARVAERCDRTGLPIDWDQIAGAMRAAESAPLRRVESLLEVAEGLVIARGVARDLLGDDVPLPAALAQTDAWVARRRAVQPHLQFQARDFALPADATLPETARALDTAEGGLLQETSTASIRTLSLALVHWFELRRRATPIGLTEEAGRLRLIGALEALFDHLPGEDAEGKRWVDGVLVRLATATPPRDPCLARALRPRMVQHGLPEPTWLPDGPCVE